MRFVLADQTGSDVAIIDLLKSVQNFNQAFLELMRTTIGSCETLTLYHIAYSRILDIKC